MNTETPAWLTDKIESTWDRESASESSRIFAQGFSSAFDEAQHNAVNMTHQKAMLDVNQKNLEITAQSNELSAQQRDQPAWMDYQSKALKDPSTPQPGWESQKYQSMGESFGMKLQANEIAKQKVQNSLDIAKVKSDSDAARIQAIKDNNAANIKSREKIAELKKSADDDFTPKEIPFGNATLIQLGPHRWQYVRGEVVKEMSPDKLLAFANGLDDGNPNKDFLKKAAEVAAVKQVTKTPAVGGKATQAGKPTTGRVVVKGPNGESGTMEKDDTLPEGWKIE
jgi:hypothetical protein